MFSQRNKKAQSTLEYAVVIAIIVGALLATQVYIKRGIQGRLKQASDDIGEQFSAGGSTYNYVTTTNVFSNEHVEPLARTGIGTTGLSGTQNASITTTETDQWQQRTGTEKVSTYGDTDEYWGPGSSNEIYGD